MTARKSDPEPEDVEELEEPEDLDEDDDEEDDDEALPAAAGDEEGDEASLEELLAQRAARRAASDDVEDETDIMSIAPEPEVPAGEPLPAKVIPIKDRQEFVCNRCHLVKARVQLADAERGLCRDCV